MKRVITFVLLLLMNLTIGAQTTGDSLLISDMVKQQIKEIEQKQKAVSEISAGQQNQQAKVEAMPVKSETVKAETAKSSFSLSETQYLLLFAAIETAFAAVFIRRHYLRKRAGKNQPAAKNDNLPTPGHKKYISRTEFAQMRTNLVCQIALVKTKEEMVRQAKKMNVGTGELELALKLQEMGEGHA